MEPEKFWLRVKTPVHEKISAYGCDLMAAHVQFNNLIGAMVANGYQVDREVGLERIDLTHPERDGLVVLELLDHERGTQAILDDLFGDLDEIFSLPIAEPFQRRVTR